MFTAEFGKFKRMLQTFETNPLVPTTKIKKALFILLKNSIYLILHCFILKTTKLIN